MDFFVILFMNWLVFEITQRCNNSCLYCYNVWHEKKYPVGELSLKEIKKLFNKISDERKFTGITIAGGEPLLHPDVIEVTKFLKTKFPEVAIISNGILFTEKIIIQLKKIGVDNIEISLPSIDREKYNLISGITSPDILEKIKKNIIQIKKQKFPLSISSVITKLNYKEIPKIIDFAFAVSAKNILLNSFTKGGRGIKNYDKLNINKTILIETLEMANEKSIKYNIPIYFPIPIQSCLVNLEKYKNLKFGSCVCGKYKTLIDSLGNLRICEQSYEILGNLFEFSYTNLMNNEKVEIFLNNNYKPECNVCSSFNICGGGCRFNRDFY